MEVGLNNSISNTSLNNSKNNSLSTYNKEQYLYNLFIADKCGRHEDVLNGFEAMIQKYPGNFNKSEINLFEKTIKQIIQNKQKKVNKVYNLEKEAKKQDDANEAMLLALREERTYLEGEIKSVCKRVIRLIDNYLMKNLNSSMNKVGVNPLSEKENEVFLFRLKGDLYKYLSQVEKEEDYENFLNQSKNYFKEALSVGKKNLDTYNSVYLSTVMAYSKFLQHFLKEDTDALAVLNTVYKLEKTQEILDGLEQIETEAFNNLVEIRNMITGLVEK